MHVDPVLIHRYLAVAIRYRKHELQILAMAFRYRKHEQPLTAAMAFRYRKHVPHRYLAVAIRDRKHVPLTLAMAFRYRKHELHDIHASYDLGVARFEGEVSPTLYN